MSTTVAPIKPASTKTKRQPKSDSQQKGDSQQSTQKVATTNNQSKVDEAKAIAPNNVSASASVNSSASANPLIETTNTSSQDTKKKRQVTKPKRYFMHYNLADKTEKGRYSRSPELAANKIVSEMFKTFAKEQKKLPENQRQSSDILGNKFIVCVREATHNRPKTYSLFEVTRNNIVNPKPTLLKIKNKDTGEVIGEKVVDYNHKNDAKKIDDQLPEDLKSFNNDQIKKFKELKEETKKAAAIAKKTEGANGNVNNVSANTNGSSATTTTTTVTNEQPKKQRKPRQVKATTDANVTTTTATATTTSVPATQQGQSTQTNQSNGGEQPKKQRKPRQVKEATK